MDEGREVSDLLYLAGLNHYLFLNFMKETNNPMSVMNLFSLFHQAPAISERIIRSEDLGLDGSGERK